MRDSCLQELTYLETVFRRLECQVPQPQPQPFGNGFFFRYRERTVQQAVLQKLARQISGLHAIDVLLLNGLLQEQAVVQRMLDEVGEDIQFVALGMATNEWTQNHIRFMDDFWREEFDNSDVLQSTQKRGMVARDKIRAFISRAGGLADPSTADRVGRFIHKTYSGYVHAASPQIMDMYGGMPPRFHLAGLRGTHRMRIHAADAVNYFYRALLSAFMVTKVFGDELLADEVYKRIRTFENTHDDKIFPDANGKYARFRPSLRRS